ncbi:MAG: EF-P lysine aminoacylase EpmA [Pseudomonadota bacterium]
MALDWRPGVEPDVLRTRAELLAQIRDYFARTGALEVSTPSLLRFPSLEPAIRNLPVGERFLRTSPESAMKRLLAAGSGDIYELARVYRDDEAGTHHAVEFTLLEWYRVGFDHHQLMDDVQALLATVMPALSLSRRTFGDACLSVLGFNPLDCATQTLCEAALKHGFQTPTQDRAMLLEYLFAVPVAAALKGKGVFISDFPPELRAYARLSTDGMPVAERFELIIDGVEIANGYHELTSATEQQALFEHEQRQGDAARRIDERWLGALQAGMPGAAGVALGVDRLLMLVAGASSLAEVAFLE